MACNCKVLVAVVAVLSARAARITVEEHNQIAQADVQENLDLAALTQKQDSGGNATFHVSIASGTAIGRVHLALSSAGSSVTNQGFSKSHVEEIYWKSGSILGKDDDSVWPIASPGHHIGSTSFTFDHGASDLVFGDLLDSNEQFYRLEFEEVVYRRSKSKNPAQNPYQQNPYQQNPYQQNPYQQNPYQQNPGNAFEQSAEEAVAAHLKEEIKESRLAMGQWNGDGYFTPSRKDHLVKTISYSPRLQAKKQFWEETGGKFDKVVMKRPAIMDIDNLFAEMPVVGDMTARSSALVNADKKYQGGPGVYPSLGKCVESTSPKDIALHLAGMFCGRTASERCSSEAECAHLGGRWKAKYCMEKMKGSGEACGCCKDIGKFPSNSGGSMRAQIRVEWLAPVLSRFSCAPVDSKWAKTGASSLFIAMGWSTESDGGDLDIDLSLVPLDASKRVIKNKLVFFNNKVPQALNCYNGRDVAMRAFADDRSGDAPGDDEMVKIDLGCLSSVHADIDAVVVMANIYKPRLFTWNMLDSVYMRLIAGGQASQQGENFFVHDAESIRSFVRLTGDAAKADAQMESDGLAVGMLFKDAEGDWAFAGLLEGVPGQTAQHSIPGIERLAQTLTYPVSEDWDASIGKETQEVGQCVRKK